MTEANAKGQFTDCVSWPLRFQGSNSPKRFNYPASPDRLAARFNPLLGILTDGLVLRAI